MACAVALGEPLEQQLSRRWMTQP
jgi:hypothetical protein